MSYKTIMLLFSRAVQCIVETQSHSPSPLPPKQQIFSTNGRVQLCDHNPFCPNPLPPRQHRTIYQFLKKKKVAHASAAAIFLYGARISPPCPPHSLLSSRRARRSSGGGRRAWG
jgi:hypothetical protein